MGLNQETIILSGQQSDYKVVDLDRYKDVSYPIELRGDNKTLFTFNAIMAKVRQDIYNRISAGDWLGQKLIKVFVEMTILDAVKWNVDVIRQLNISVDSNSTADDVMSAIDGATLDINQLFIYDGEANAYQSVDFK